MAKRSEFVGEVEIRFTEDGSVDEIVVPGRLHMERLSENQVWIGLYGGGKQRFVNIFSPAGVAVTAEEEEDDADPIDRQ